MQNGWKMLASSRAIRLSFLAEEQNMIIDDGLATKTDIDQTHP